MAVAQTKAASYIQQHTDEISPHQIISLLMDGALERVAQAKNAHKKNKMADLETLTHKLVAIINGLRNSLNMEAGDIAHNLDALYEYMLERLSQADRTTLFATLEEVERLIGNIKSGWDGMDFSDVKDAAEAVS